jgi:hypothetical protein
MQWSLGDKPIESMVRLLESKGVRVFSLPGDVVAADTFSMWHQDRPYVLLNRRKIETQLRFDAARELGHLLLHVPATGRQAQERATNFASAFLMPMEIAKTGALPTGANDPLHVGEAWGLAHLLNSLYSRMRLAAGRAVPQPRPCLPVIGAGRHP